VSRLSTTADWVLIDSPALLSTGMTLSLAPAVDGVLVVAQHGRTRRGQAESVRAALASLGVEKVGVVLLNTPARQTASA
jgi:Mrp family chromosome partitioning ATPase